jgi:catechol 2,3-dioxygenase-like lactoylglutathione lyase family enzyme
MLAQLPVVGIIPVTDFALAESFYCGKLGLPVLDRENPFALVLQAANGTTIRCAKVAEHKPQPFTILGWEVPDMAAAVAGLKAAGIEPLRYGFPGQDEDGIWTAPGGSQVVWFSDPDGNVLSLSRQQAKANG